MTHDISRLCFRDRFYQRSTKDVISPQGRVEIQEGEPLFKNKKRDRILVFPCTEDILHCNMFNPQYNLSSSYEQWL